MLVQVILVLAIVPLLGLLFGFGFTSRVIVCVIIALFPIVTNTLFGLKSADQGMHGFFSLMKVRGPRGDCLSCSFRPPARLLHRAARIAGGAAVVGAVVGDFFSSAANRARGADAVLQHPVADPAALRCRHLLRIVGGCHVHRAVGTAHTRHGQVVFAHQEIEGS